MSSSPLVSLNTFRTRSDASSIPNMVGLNGSLQKLFDPTVFEIHMSLKKEALAEAHRHNGLEVISCSYFLPLNLSVINVEAMKGKFGYVIITRTSSWLSKLTWLVDGAVPLLGPNRRTSPYIHCLSRKPCA